MALELKYSIATQKDVRQIVDLRNAAASALVKVFGPGHWANETTERGVGRGITNTSKVLLVWRVGKIIGSLRLAQKKPWAIDDSHFTKARRPLYLLDMAIHPRMQRKGIGRAMITQAVNMARLWPGDAIRLDAYSTDAGAGGFYASCGFKEVGRVSYRGVPLIYYERMITGAGSK